MNKRVKRIRLFKFMQLNNVWGILEIMAMEFPTTTNQTDAHIYNSERLKIAPSLQTTIQRTPSKVNTEYSEASATHARITCLFL